MSVERKIQGGSNMPGTDLCVNKPVTVPVIFEPPCITTLESMVDAHPLDTVILSQYKGKDRNNMEIEIFERNCVG